MSDAFTAPDPSRLRPLRSFEELNRTRPYAKRIKPANFVLSAQVAPFGHPVGVDPEHFHPLAPYERDATKWLSLPWFDKYSGQPWPISVDPVPPPDRVRVATYRDVAERYAVHPEPKSAASDGQPCTKKTRGLLQRRHVQVGGVRYVGKESNRLDEVEHGLVHSLDEVQATYEDPSLDLWPTVVVPILKLRTAETWAREIGCSPRTIKRLRNGHGQASPEIRRRLLRAIDRWATPQLARRRPDPKRVELAQQFRTSHIQDDLDRPAPRSRRRKRR